MTILEDPAAAHQIRIRKSGQGLVVTCTCLNACTGTWRSTYWPGQSWTDPGWTGTRIRGEAIETRSVFPAAEAIAAWRHWHEQKGIRL